MDFEDLQRQWRAAVDQPLDQQQRLQFQNDVRQRCLRVERSVRRRDFIEILAAIGLMIWIGVSWPRVSATWLSAIGTGSLFAWVVSVIVILSWTRHRTPTSIDAPFNDFIHLKLQWCDDQIRLLSSIAWWYVLPPLGSGLLIVWSKAAPHNLVRICIMSAIMIGFGFYVIRLNHRTSNRHFRSLRDELALMLEDCE